MSGKTMALYKSNPGAYTVGSYNNAKAGRICAIVGLSLSALYLIFIIIYLAVIGAALSAMPWDMLNQ